MDANTGDLYKNREEGEKAGVDPKDLVELTGREEAIRKVADKVKLATQFNFGSAKARRKMQRLSRRKNRP